jgi:NADH:ubiquinone oxidoreductase subunit 2 (subunit N)
MYGLTGAFDFFNIKNYFLFYFSKVDLIFYLMVLSFIFSFLFKLSSFPGHM